MPFHICPQEIALFVMSLPFVAVMYARVKARLARRTKP